MRSYPVIWGISETPEGSLHKAGFHGMSQGFCCHCLLGTMQMAWGEGEIFRTWLRVCVRAREDFFLLEWKRGSTSTPSFMYCFNLHVKSMILLDDLFLNLQIYTSSLHQMKHLHPLQQKFFVVCINVCSIFLFPKLQGEDSMGSRHDLPGPHRGVSPDTRNCSKASRIGSKARDLPVMGLGMDVFPPPGNEAYPTFGGKAGENYVQTYQLGVS